VDINAGFYLAGLARSTTFPETPFFVTSIALFWWNLIISSTVECTYRRTPETTVTRWRAMNTLYVKTHY